MKKCIVCITDKLRTTNTLSTGKSYYKFWKFSIYGSRVMSPKISMFFPLIVRFKKSKTLNGIV